MNNIFDPNKGFTFGTSSFLTNKQQVETESTELKEIVTESVNDVTKQVNTQVNNVVQDVNTQVNNVVQEVNTQVTNQIDNVVYAVNKEVSTQVNKAQQKITNFTTKLNEIVSDQSSPLSKALQIEAELKAKPSEEKKDNLLVVPQGPRTRKTDRRTLANDILAELPISIRFNDSINTDNDEMPVNYIEDWEMWIEEDEHKLDALIEEIKVAEDKYKTSASFNHNCARFIQFSLLLFGSSVVYLQAAGTNTDAVSKFTIASSSCTTIATTFLTFFSFSKKAPHYAKISYMCKRLRNWIEKLIIMPIHKRSSPYDIYTIAKITFEAIITEAKEGLNDHK